MRPADFLQAFLSTAILFIGICAATYEFVTDTNSTESLSGLTGRSCLTSKGDYSFLFFHPQTPSDLQAAAFNIGDATLSTLFGPTTSLLQTAISRRGNGFEDLAQLLNAAFANNLTKTGGYVLSTRSTSTVPLENTSSGDTTARNRTSQSIPNPNAAVSVSSNPWDPFTTSEGLWYAFYSDYRRQGAHASKGVVNRFIVILIADVMAGARSQHLALNEVYPQPDFCDRRLSERDNLMLMYNLDLSRTTVAVTFQDLLVILRTFGTWINTWDGDDSRRLVPGCSFDISKRPAEGPRFPPFPRVGDGFFRIAPLYG